MDKYLLSHIGIAVSDLERAAETYKLITGSHPEYHDVPDQKVRVAMFGATGEGYSGARIELVAPTSDDSPIAKYLSRKGEGLHHICIYVDDIEARLSQLKSAGAKLIDEIPRIGAEGNKIAFVHPAAGHGVLIELEERS
jgi:methylmalonyl-CoA/ethylmalonyl-CoA epimerase